MSPTDVLKQSNLGIEYSEMFPSKLASILSHAEFEWVDNASEIYWDDVGEIWAGDILTRFSAWTLQDCDYEEMQLYLPNMLSALRWLHIDDSRDAILSQTINILTSKL